MTSQKPRRTDRRRARQGWAAAACVLALALGAGCTPRGEFQPVSMWNDSRLKPYEPGLLPTEASSARLLPAGVVARGSLRKDDPRLTGMENGRHLRDIPFAVTREVVARGQERYNIFCAPCHGRLGNGEGMVVQRGFPPPPDYAIRRLRDAPAGHFYDVITSGYGVMYSYAASVPPNDRWAITAYIRVLQAARKEVPEERQIEERIRARGVSRGNPHRP